MEDYEANGTFQSTDQWHADASATPNDWEGWCFHQRNPPVGWDPVLYGEWERSEDGQQDGLYVLLVRKIPSRHRSSMLKLEECGLQGV